MIPRPPRFTSTDTRFPYTTLFLSRANADRSVSCVIITGAGKSFCSGGNLHELRDLTATRKLTQPELADWYRNGIQTIPAVFHELDVVTIAAVGGHAIGAGCDLAAMCDLRIAAPDASFAESFVRVDRKSTRLNSSPQCAS